MISIATVGGWGVLVTAIPMNTPLDAVAFTAINSLDRIFSAANSLLLEMEAMTVIDPGTISREM